jgi:hypothetical protein
MNVEDLPSWVAFIRRLAQLIDERTDPSKPASQFLFRGQSDSEWKLSTTLERFAPEAESIADYFKIIRVIKPQIEAMTGKSWELPEYNAVDQLLADYDTFSRALIFGQLPGYEYLAYLRHHGFPSPLLDWTNSPYIAAYFAFNEPPKANEKVSMYAYLERPSFGKAGSSQHPRIYTFGPYIKTHPRHYLQRSEYSLCAFHKEEWTFAPHESVFDRNDVSQDLLWKFNIPSGERLTVLKALDDYNLNSFSLFGSEESLMNTMALRELAFRAI